MKPLTLEEVKLKEEMKERCLAKGQYVDENAKAKFEMLCHLEDFEVQYWELQKENQQLKNDINKLQKELNEENLQCSKNAIEINDLKEKNKQLKDNWNKLKEYAKENLYFYSGYQGEDLEIDISIQGILDKMQELEQGGDNNGQ